MSNDLAIRSTAREMANAFAQAEQEVRAQFAAILATQDRLDAAFGLVAYDSIKIDATHRGHDCDFRDVDRAIKRMARQAWGHIVARLELKRKMSIKRYDDLERDLQDLKIDLPAITEENVVKFAQGYIELMPDMIAEAVGEVFEFLRPHRSAHKTNTELEIGRKVILTGVLRGRTMAGRQATSYWSSRFVALENVFTHLDGHGQVNKQWWSALEQAFSSADEGATPYFAFKCYGNGNLHIEFKRLDLLAKLNKMAGGMRMRPAA